MLPTSLMPAFEGVFPLTLITSSAEGIPNITNLSRIWVVDSGHVAAANQMLSKSADNLSENPLALLCLVDPGDLMHWEVEVSFIRAETEGILYDRIKDDLQTVSWMASGQPDLVPLRSAFVFQVISTRKCKKESDPIDSNAERFGDLLQAAAEIFEWNRTSYWVLNDWDTELKLAASRDASGAGIGSSNLEPMRRLASLVKDKQSVIRLQNIRSQLRYLHTVRTEADKQADPNIQQWEQQRERELKTSFLGIPLVSTKGILGMICCEAMTAEAEMFDRFDDDFLEKLSRRLGEAVLTSESLPPDEYNALFRQSMERTHLEWAKSKDPFHTVLSARERQVAICAAKGLTNVEIAQSLFISKRTVTTHLERIYQKLEVTSRAALTRYIMENSLHLNAGDGITH